VVTRAKNHRVLKKEDRPWVLWFVKFHANKLNALREEADLAVEHTSVRVQYRLFVGCPISPCGVGAGPPPRIRIGNGGMGMVEVGVDGARSANLKCISVSVSCAYQKDGTVYRFPFYV